MIFDVFGGAQTALLGVEYPGAAQYQP